MSIVQAGHGAGARKALASKWSHTTPASLPQMMFGSGPGPDSSLLNPETPSKSLLGTDTSSSMLFSPLSVSKVGVVVVRAPSVLSPPPPPLMTSNTQAVAV